MYEHKDFWVPRILETDGLRVIPSLLMKLDELSKDGWEFVTRMEGADDRTNPPVYGYILIMRRKIQPETTDAKPNNAA